MPPPAPAPAQAERRQLTVMFCDLVGSTALSTGMDPEDLRDVIASFQSRCSAAIRRYDGFVAKYMGDGILVYFGYPRAHEDEAERSVRAGLDIVDAMAELNAAVRRPPGVELAVRIGIATGPVIVGDQIGEGTASETAVVGETPNLAARLQALAQPNQIVVSAATRAMLGDHFDLEDLGASELKGFAEPVPAWRVLSARDVESRFAATRTGSSAPLVGRQEEMGLLLRAWDGSSHGRGQVVLIQGEAGRRQVPPGGRPARGGRQGPHLGGDPLLSVSHGERISSDHRTFEARVRLAAGGYRAAASGEARSRARRLQDLAPFRECAGYSPT